MYCNITLLPLKTPEAKQRLQEQFKDHSAGRAYVALVEGWVALDHFTLRSVVVSRASDLNY